MQHSYLFDRLSETLQSFGVKDAPHLHRINFDVVDAKFHDFQIATPLAFGQTFTNHHDPTYFDTYLPQKRTPLLPQWLTRRGHILV